MLSMVGWGGGVYYCIHPGSRRYCLLLAALGSLELDAILGTRRLELDRRLAASAERPPDAERISARSSRLALTLSALRA